MADNNRIGPPPGPLRPQAAGLQPPGNAASSHGAARPAQNSRVGNGLALLPTDVLGHVSSFVPVRHMRALAVDGQAGPAVRFELRQLRTISESLDAVVAAASDLPSFRRALGGGNNAGASNAGTIAGMRRDLQFRPLTALLRRIPNLPVNEQQQASRAFREHVDRLGADQRSAALMTFHRITEYEYAGIAAMAGENIQLACAHFGVTNPENIATVERSAINGAAGEAIQRGESLLDVIQHHGFATPMGIAALERAAARGPVRLEVTGGQNVQEVAQRLGFRTEEGIQALEATALSGAAGEAVRTAAENALRGGQTLHDIAEQYGLTSRTAYMRMEQIALSRVLAHPELSREEPLAVAASIGIESPVFVDMLTLLSAHSNATPW